MTRFKGDDNYKAGGVVGGYSSADSDTELSPTIIPFRLDPVTKRVLVDATVSGDGISDGDAVDAATLGFLFLGSDGANYRAVLTDASGHLQVDVLSGGGGGTLVKDNDAINANNTGQIILGTDGSNYQVLATGATGTTAWAWTEFGARDGVSFALMPVAVVGGTVVKDIIMSGIIAFPR